MNAELDYDLLPDDLLPDDLLPDQWETLKALRAAATLRRAPSRFVIEQLVELGLADTSGERPQITPMGRKVLIRGSSRLWEDVAA